MRCPAFRSRKKSLALGLPSTWTQMAWPSPSVRTRGVADRRCTKHMKRVNIVRYGLIAIVTVGIISEAIYFPVSALIARQLLKLN